MVVSSFAKQTSLFAKTHVFRPNHTTTAYRIYEPIYTRSTCVRCRLAIRLTLYKYYRQTTSMRWWWSALPYTICLALVLHFARMIEIATTKHEHRATRFIMGIWRIYIGRYCISNDYATAYKQRTRCPQYLFATQTMYITWHCAFRYGEPYRTRGVPREKHKNTLIFYVESGRNATDEDCICRRFLCL